MSSAIKGYGAYLYVSANGGSSYEKVAEIREVTLTIESENIDVTSHDSSGWREFVPGLKGWTVSAEKLYTENDTASANALAAILGGTTLLMKYRPQEGSGFVQYTGTLTVTSWEEAGPNDDAVAGNVEFQGTGTLTKTTQ